MKPPKEVWVEDTGHGFRISIRCSMRKYPQHRYVPASELTRAKELLRQMRELHPSAMSRVGRDVDDFLFLNNTEGSGE